MQCRAATRSAKGNRRCQLEAMFEIRDSAPEPLWTYACVDHLGHEVAWMASDHLPVVINVVSIGH